MVTSGIGGIEGPFFEDLISIEAGVVAGDEFFCIVVAVADAEAGPYFQCFEGSVFGHEIVG